MSYNLITVLSMHFCTQAFLGLSTWSPDVVLPSKARLGVLLSRIGVWEKAARCLLKSESHMMSNCVIVLHLWHGPGLLFMCSSMKPHPLGGGGDLMQVIHQQVTARTASRTHWQADSNNDLSLFCILHNACEIEQLKWGRRSQVFLWDPQQRTMTKQR